MASKRLWSDGHALRLFGPMSEEAMSRANQAEVCWSCRRFQCGDRGETEAV